MISDFLIFKTFKWRAYHSKSAEQQLHTISIWYDLDMN